MWTWQKVDEPLGTPKLMGQKDCATKILSPSLEPEFNCYSVYARYSSVTRSGTEQRGREVLFHFDFACLDFTLLNQLISDHK